LVDKITALIPLKVTLVAPSGKTPLIATRAPLVAVLGENPVIVGGIRNIDELLLLPAIVVTVMKPLLEPLGTVV